MEADTTRMRLLDAAAEVFLEQGLAAASMEQVRQRAGASNGSTYHHFPSKAALADALYARLLSQFHAALLQPLSSRAAAATVVKGLLRAYLNWVLAQPNEARLLHEMKPAAELPREAAAWQRTNSQGLGQLHQWVAARTDAGQMRALPFDVWMALVFAPALSLTPRWLRQADGAAATPAVRNALESAAWAAVAP